METGENSALVVQTDTNGGVTRVHLMLEGRKVSWLSIVPFKLQIGAAQVHMDGIGGVGTDPHYRHRGYSRRVLEAAVTQMRQGDAALSMLYGIPDFYPKFGYETAGPDFLLILTDLERDNSLPSGWSVRDFVLTDLPAMQALYRRCTERAVGAAVRSTEGGVWSHLTGDAGEDEEPDACRVIIGPDSELHGYVWRARWCWYVKHKLETDFREALVIGEVMADGSLAADAVLAVCRQWAQTVAEHRKVKQVVLAAPPEGVLASAAMRQYARFMQNYSACGNSMARVLDVKRLLHALAPELLARLHAAQSRFVGTLVFETDLGDAMLRITPDAVTVERDIVSTANTLRVVLPQTELARLALGAFPPGDILARLPEPPSEQVASVLKTLFPLRFPHMYLPDRY